MLFDNFSTDEREQVKKMGRVKKYGYGDEIIKENESGDSMFIVLSGRLEVKKGIDEGRNKKLKELQAGEFFGEMSFFDRLARSADVVAASDCELMELSMENVDKLVADNPVLGAKLYKNLARELTIRLRANNDELRRTIVWAIEGWTYA